MGSNTSKLRCLYLPAQSGKTRKSEELIAEVKATEKVSGKESIDIWISANNKLLVYQTTSRLTKDLGTPDYEKEDWESNAVIKGKIFSWTSGTKATNIPHSALALKCMDDEVEAIIVCAHKVRLEYIAELIKTLSKPKYRFTKNINIWIDEADKSCKLWLKQEIVIGYPLVDTVTLVSATFAEVFKKFETLKVIPYVNTHPTVYKRLKDCIKVEEDLGTADAATYVDLILHKYKKLATPGLRAFVPGNVAKVSHEAVAEILLSHGFAVIILNGDKKELRIPTEDPEVPTIIELRPYLTIKDPEAIPDEFNVTLAKLYIEHKLDRFPLGITGFICVERGITFQLGPADDGSHKGFLFDYAIVSPIKDKAEAYQSMARVFGNVGGIEGYKKATIYSDTKTFERVRDQEEAAVYVARIAHDEGLELVDASVLKRASCFHDERMWRLQMNEFETFEEAKAFVKAHGTGTLRQPVLEDDGFYHSSTTKKKTLLAHKDVLEEMRGWSKTSVFDVNKDPERTFHSRLVICYKDLEDSDSAVFLVRSIQKIKESGPRKGLVRLVPK
jgi:hypothetical protein